MSHPPLHLHWLQHVPFEGLGYIETWAADRGIKLSCTRLFAHEKLPSPDSFDGLIVMGGSMGIYDHAEHPWLVKEKEFIRTAIAAQKPVLGICLGAQLIADVLGTRVYSGPQKEIGWFPIHRAENTTELLPTEQTVFHWHGDTFDCPNGATCLASTPTCPNQGFIYKNHVVALQFHLETTPESMQSIIENSTAELAESAAGTATFQTAEQMQTFQPDFKALHNTLQNILHFLFIR